jgi:hypothetical protein
LLLRNEFYLPGVAGGVGGVGGVPLCPPPLSTMMWARFQASMQRFGRTAAGEVEQESALVTAEGC